MKPEVLGAAPALGAVADAAPVPNAGLLCAPREAPPLAPKEKPEPEAGPLLSAKAGVPDFSPLPCSEAGAFAIDPKTGASPPPKAGALPDAPNIPVT